MKRALSLLLAVGLVAGSLSGCGTGGEQKTTPMGRYIEKPGETLSGVDRVADLRLDADGNAVFYAYSRGEGAPTLERVTIRDGALERERVALGQGIASVRGVSESADGTVYLLANGDDGRSRVCLLKDGAVAEVPVADWDQPAAGGGSDAAGSASVALEDGAAVFYEDDTQRYALGIRALDGGDFLLLYGNEGISRYSGTDGALMLEYPSCGYNANVAVYGGTLLTPGPDGKENWFYDLDTGERTGSTAYDNLNFTTAQGMDENGIYLADNTGIYRQSMGGNVWERLVDGDLTSLSMPVWGAEALAPDGTGGFYAILSGAEKYQIMRYVFDPETPSVPDTELVIFGLRDSNTVRQAIGEFQRRNPNVRVNFQVMLDGDSGATAEDVIRTLNTELVAGKGPDLLLLDGLPVESYIEKGVLADMTEQLRGLTESGSLLDHFSGAYLRDGKAYGVPARFTFPVMMGRKELVAGVGSLEDLVARAEELQSGEPQFLWTSDHLFDSGGMLMDYYDAEAGRFLTGDGGLDRAALEAYLSAMLRLDRCERANAPEVDGSAILITTVSTSGSGGMEVVDPGAMQVGAGRAQFHVQELGGQFALSAILSNLGKAGNAPVISFTDGGTKEPDGPAAERPEYALDTLFGGSAYTPVGAVGITTAGKQQELARAFVELLLSPAVQDNYLYDGFPVNGGSLDKLVADVLKDGGDDMGFRALCGGLKTPILVDQVVREAVMSQTAGLLDGTLTPAEAAANVEEKTQIYLSE